MLLVDWPDTRLMIGYLEEAFRRIEARPDDSIAQQLKSGVVYALLGTRALLDGSDPVMDPSYTAIPDIYAKDTQAAHKAILEDIEKVSKQGVAVYTPIKDKQKKRARGEDPYAPRKRDSKAVAAWRKRMGTEEAQAIYPERAAAAEFVNAGARNHGLQQFLVRGLRKVTAVALWHALAHNFLRTLNLRSAAAT